jgi:hypothetical protein
MRLLNQSRTGFQWCSSIPKFVAQPAANNTNFGIGTLERVLTIERDVGFSRVKRTRMLAPQADVARSHAPDHSPRMPATFTTLAHFAVSAAMSLPKSAGEPGIAAPPRSRNRAFIVGLARPRLISLLSLSMI